MKWGDFIEEDGPTTFDDIADDVLLLTDQVIESLPLLEKFDLSKPYRIGWYIEQDDTNGGI